MYFMQPQTDEPGPAMARPEVLAIIPARGGSKGIAGKNIRNLAGRPLVAYSILSALSARQVTRVIVSTDSPAIAEVSMAWGAEIPFLRPPELADDKALIGSTLNHALGRLATAGYHPDVVVTLYPTHPFRPAGLVDEMVSLCLDGASRVNTVKPVERMGQGFFKAVDGDFQLIDEGAASGGRYVRNSGLVLAHRREALKDVHHIRLVEDPVCNVDIDELEDWFLAEGIIRRNLFSFEWHHDRACAGV